jgi:HAD superfamily hydrolase (TIGR01459 family)
VKFDIQILNGLSETAENYDIFLLDLWGVVHNGSRLYEDVLSCLEKLRASNKTTILLSNAPRNSGSVIEKLQELGLPRHLYDDILTSGDMTLDHLRRHPSKTYYFIGCPEKDSSLLAGIGKNPVEDMAQAEIIVVSNLQSERPNLNDYHDDFKRAIANKIPMICANPDIIVNYEDKIVYCSGALAMDYEKFGGKVTSFGKPYSHMYERLLKQHPNKRFLALGDSLATDIKGAIGASIDSALVLSGIHGHEILADDRGTWSLFDEYQAIPNYILNRFSW